MTNAEIAKKLFEMAAYYEMKISPDTKVSDAVVYKPRAYERAAQAVMTFPEPLEEIYRHGGEKLIANEVPGIGPGIARHVAQMVKTGTFPELERERTRMPVDLERLLEVDMVGPRTIRTLYRKLKVKTVDDLERAARDHKIDGLAHFGEKSEQKILKSIERLKRSTGRHLLGVILPLSRTFEARIKRIPGVTEAVTAGSVRRRQETIGDIDILVTARDPRTVHDAFMKMPEVREVVRSGDDEGITSVIIEGNIRADVRILKEDEYGAGLQYFTGDKNHNVKLRTLAIRKGMKLSEYGLFKGRKRIAARNEEEIYEALGLDWMPPELRTDSGELDAARTGTLPTLIRYDDLKGDLQVQSDWTDGNASIAEMAEAARKAGLSYIAVTDHTVSLAMTRGLNEKRIEAQGKEIGKLNTSLRGFRVLRGSEVNIDRHGGLDITDRTLAELEVVGASVHSHFALPRAEQTKRLIRAIEHPHVDVIFHPTGRKLQKRDEIELDMDAVIAAAKRTGTALEVNASPDRLDLRDEYVRLAVRSGVRLMVNSDAHAANNFGWLALGIAQARRGWATKADVLNTRPVGELLKWLQTPKNKRK